MTHPICFWGFKLLSILNLHIVFFPEDEHYFTLFYSFYYSQHKKNNHIEMGENEGLVIFSSVLDKIVKTSVSQKAVLGVPLQNVKNTNT